MSHNAIDYFATLGRAPGPLVCKSFPMTLDEDCEPLSGAQIWEEAITDLIVLGPGDELMDEESWVFLNETVGGSAVTDQPIVAFRKRVHSKRQDHITQVRFVANGDGPAPEGFEILRYSASGKHSAQIKGYGFLAFKRADPSPFALLEGQPLLYDMCVVRKSAKEDIPDRYVVLDKDIVASLPTLTTVTNDLLFAIRTLPAMGVCNLAYKPATLDRYPTKDHRGLALPEDALPVFAFPRNLPLQVNSLHEYPLPVFYTFVFTDQEGHHLYAACLKFYEAVPLTDLEDTAKSIYGEEAKLELAPGKCIFSPKVICVLSGMPFYRAMRRYLRHIYSISLSASICPIEHFITSVVGQVPLPVEGGRPFHVVLDAALISHSSKPMTPVIFELPPQQFFPIMDLDFAGPMRCMNIDTMLAVFTLMLRESKILFVSCSNTLLTETMETLRLLLFPLMWSSCFVSRLPSALTGLLQAPGGFMIGLHLDPSELFRHSTSATAAQGIYHDDVRKYIQQMHYDYPMVAGSYVVDLTSSCIYVFNGRVVELLSSTQVEHILKTLPTGPKLRLRTKLKKIADDFNIAPQLGGLEEFDSAFDFVTTHSAADMDMDSLHDGSINSSNNNNTPTKSWDEFPTLELRDSFMSFMIDMLGDYTKYIIPPIEDLTADTYRTFKEEFQVQSYIQEADHSCKVLLEHLMETQMFAVLLQQRSEGSSHNLVFFEQAAQLQRDLGLSAGGRDAHLHRMEINVCELPSELFKLVDSENKWSCLSKVMQQQILQHSLHALTAASNPNNISNHTKAGQNAQRLVMLSTSSLSPLRITSGGTSSGGHNPQTHASFHVTFTPQNIQNQQLKDLLTYITFTHTTPLYEKDDESLSPYYVSARKELDRQEDLHLAAADFGPLILPGPILSGSVDPPQNTSEDAVKYSYSTGWPKLQPELLASVEDFVHGRLQELRKERLFTLSQINPKVRMFIRSPSERLALEIVRSSTEEEKVQISPSLTPLVTAIMDIASVSMTMLAIRSTLSLRPVNDVLQILGTIAQIESWGLVTLVHESSWRSALIACSATGGDVMRRIAIVLFESLHACHISPNALTYGQYSKAIAAKKTSSDAAVDAKSYLDQFLYLEEMGLTWFIQKAALSKQPMVYSLSTAYPSAANSVKLQLPANTRGSKKSIKRINTEAAALVCSQLSLKRSSGLMPFLHPSTLTASCIPLSAESFSTSDKLGEVKASLQSRLDTLYVESKAFALQSHSTAEAGVNKRNNNDLSPVRDGAARPVSGTHDSSGNSISPMNMVSRLGTMMRNTVQGGTGASTSPTPNTTQSNTAAASSTWSKLMGNTSSSTATNKPKPEVSPQPNARLQSELDQREKVAVSNLNFDEDDELDEEDDDTSAPTAISSNKGSSSASSKSMNEVMRLQNDLLDSFVEEFSKRGKVIGIHNYTECHHCHYAMMDEEILSLWCHGASIDVHQTNKRMVPRQDTMDDCHVESGLTCPHCAKAFSPELHITCYGIDKLKVDNFENPILKGHFDPLINTPDDEVSSRADDKLMVLWDEKVQYLSPFVVRFEVEELVLKVGECVGYSAWMHQHSPALFWNILWYTSRCHLPAGFFPMSPRGSNSAPASPTVHRSKFHHKLEHSAKSAHNLSDEYDLLSPVIIGWRDCVVRAKAFRILEGIPGDYVDFKDMFPMCTIKEQSIITNEVLPNLDGSPSSLRLAILAINECPSMMQTFIDSCGGSRARVLYVIALFFAVQCGHYPLFDSKLTGFSRELAKECKFHAVFIDCIKIIMSPMDFEVLKCDEESMVDCARDLKTNAVRSMFGLLA